MRQLLHLLVLLSVSYMSSLSYLQAQPPLLHPKTQPQCVHSLPIPAVLDGRSGGTFDIPISQFWQHLGWVGPATGQPLQTTVWGYGGTFPELTIRGQWDVPGRVFGQNHLVDHTRQPPGAPGKEPWFFFNWAFFVEC